MGLHKQEARKKASFRYPPPTFQIGKTKKKNKVNTIIGTELMSRKET
jgi:hypothetical protein